MDILPLCNAVYYKKGEKEVLSGCVKIPYEVEKRSIMLRNDAKWCDNDRYGDVP
jgi:hypothetical protein